MIKEKKYSILSEKNNICPWYAKGVFYDFLSTAFYPELLALIQAPQGAYLKEELPQMYRENAEYISFEMLWVLYKNGFDTF